MRSERGINPEMRNDRSRAIEPIERLISSSSRCCVLHLLTAFHVTAVTRQHPSEQRDQERSEGGGNSGRRLFSRRPSAPPPSHPARAAECAPTGGRSPSSFALIPGPKIGAIGWAIGRAREGETEECGRLPRQPSGFDRRGRADGAVRMAPAARRLYDRDS